MDINAISDFLKEAVNEYDSDDEKPWKPVEVLMPFLHRYGMVNRTSTAEDVQLTDLRELAIRWGVKLKDARTRKDMNFNDLLAALTTHTKAQSSLMPGALTNRASSSGVNFDSLTPAQAATETQLLKDKEKQKKQAMRLSNNYMGMPDYAYDPTPKAAAEAMIYQSRKVIVAKVDRHSFTEEDHDHHAHKEEKAPEASEDAGKAKINSSMITARGK